MKRVVQRTIDQQFFPVSPEQFAVGSTIPFDCYIKRFNGYAIVIQAGTVLSAELLAKVSRQGNCYVQHAERPAFKNYRHEHPEPQDAKAADPAPQTENALPDAEQLADALQTQEGSEAKIALLYATGRALLKRCFESGNEMLPMAELTGFGETLSHFIREEAYALEQFLKQMPSTYSDATHSLNVAILSGVLGRVVGMSQRQLEEIVLAGLLHDIGKLRIPREILYKEDTLDPDEFEKMQEHPLFGAAILKKNRIGNPQIAAAVRFHHEKRDGSGYPEGLVENQIPAAAQIIAVCDVFDALSTERTFRSAYSSFEALKLMKKEMHDQLAMRYIDGLIKLLKR